MIAFADGVAVADLSPAVQFVDRRMPRRPDQLFDHDILPSLSLSDEVRAPMAEVKRRIYR
jgi:hypothetical protein